VQLEKGVNDVGLLIEQKDADGAYQYNDFWRVKVLYALPDLAGTWEGNFQIQEAGRARDYVEEALVRILLWTGLAKDEAQAREAAQASITEDPNLRLPRPIVILFELKAADKPGQYSMRVFTIDDSTGSQVEYTGEATYKEGRVEFSFGTADRSVMEFSGEIRTADRLAGTFSMNAWGVVKNAGSGVWELNRQKP